MLLLFYFIIIIIHLVTILRTHSQISFIPAVCLSACLSTDHHVIIIIIIFLTTTIRLTLYWKKVHINMQHRPTKEFLLLHFIPQLLRSLDGNLSKELRHFTMNTCWVLTMITFGFRGSGTFGFGFGFAHLMMMLLGGNNFAGTATFAVLNYYFVSANTPTLSTERTTHAATNNWGG